MLAEVLSDLRNTQWLALVDRWKPWLLLGFGCVLGGLLFEAMRGLQAELSYHAIVNSVRQTTSHDLALAFLATAASYVALTGYDYSALRYIGVALPYRIIAPTAFTAYALSNTIGLGVLTGGAVRMRLYGAAGIDTAQISRVIAFNAVAFGVGITVVGAVASWWGAGGVALITHVPVAILQGGAASIVVGACALLVWCGSGARRRLFGRYWIHPPSALLALNQLLISAVDIALSAAVLWLLLPTGAIEYGPFVGFYAMATVLGVVSHVPGGLGVFEAIMLAALGGHVPSAALASALVLYRLIYYVVPLLLAFGLSVSQAVWRGRAQPVAQAAAALSPTLLAAATLVVGVMLLISGVTPASGERVELLRLHVPLPWVEASHFLGSVAGLALVFVAHGMVLRQDAAWWAGLVLAVTSLVLVVPKGLAVVDALFLSFLICGLVVSRKQFTRHSSLFAPSITGGWLVAVAVILVALIGLFLFAYRDVQYSHELWWQFEFDSHAPRSLRSLVAVALLALGLALRQILRPPMAPLARPDVLVLERARIIIDAQGTAGASLALMGDKYLLFADSSAAFLMFGVRGRSWISLFDPVGPESEWSQLIWRFRELARESGCRASFYQVRPYSLGLYLDAGFRLFKLGESATVSLRDFSLQGKRRGGLRSSMNRAEREGLSFEIIPAAEVVSAIDELRSISDAWLVQHQTAEKTFSLGSFDVAYVLQHAIAVVRKNARMVAFATLQSTPLKIEASADLMRHLPDAPPGTMDFLFVSMLLHFQAHNFECFSLGMAPLSGMADHPLAPNWHRLGRLLFAHGEHFYNFQGLRAFKEKFDPHWEPRYLASQGGVAPLMVLTDIAALISGGLKRIVAKG